ncbi:MAG: DUF4339 domain-containing protein [Chthoniobacterales bacterium]|nr:DUF4339 domain-containing protein [Chthoniobacterales bacterium]
MKSYLVKLSGREEGPYSDAQITQMFANREVDRDTPCRRDGARDWRTVDEYFPTLKYGTEQPNVVPATSPRALVVAPALPLTQVKIADVDVPFPSVLKMAFKIAGAWVIVGVCFVPIFVILWFLLFAGILSFFAGHLPR